MFNHFGSAAVLGRVWLHAPKQLQYRTTEEARKLTRNEQHLNESVGLLCSHQNGLENKIPQRMDHSKEYSMKNKAKSLHWTSKKCFWSPELYLMVLWGHGEVPLVPTTNQLSFASMSEKSHHPQQSCLATAGLEIVDRFFFQFSSLTFAQVKYYISFRARL